MKMFVDSHRILNAIEKTAALVDELPPSDDKERALASLTEAAGLAIRASSVPFMRARANEPAEVAPAVEACEDAGSPDQVEA